MDHLGERQSVTGASGVLEAPAPEPPFKTSSTSVSRNAFFDAPSQTPECLSYGVQTSPYPFVTTAIALLRNPPDTTDNRDRERRLATDDIVNPEHRLSHCFLESAWAKDSLAAKTNPPDTLCEAPREQKPADFCTDPMLMLNAENDSAERPGRWANLPRTEDTAPGRRDHFLRRLLRFPGDFDLPVRRHRECSLRPQPPQRGRGNRT